MMSNFSRKAKASYVLARPGRMKPSVHFMRISIASPWAKANPFETTVQWFMCKNIARRAWAL